MCNKAVKLWSEFNFNRVPGDTTAGPDELQTPGKRSKYVTNLSYKAREAGYNGGIVTRSSGDDEPFIDYSEPKSYENDNFKPFTPQKLNGTTFKSSAIQLGLEPPQGTSNIRKSINGA